MNITTEKLTGQDAQNCIELAQSDMMTPDNDIDDEEENETGIEEVSACFANNHPACRAECMDLCIFALLKWAQLEHGCTDCWVTTSFCHPQCSRAATICAWPKDRAFALKMELRPTI